MLMDGRFNARIQQEVMEKGLENLDDLFGAEDPSDDNFEYYAIQYDNVATDKGKLNTKKLTFLITFKNLFIFTDNVQPSKKYMLLVMLMVTKDILMSIHPYFYFLPFLNFVQDCFTYKC